MKHSKLFSILVVLFLNLPLIAFASTDIDLTKIPPPPPTPNTPSTQLPVSATIDNIQLMVYFESTVGNATITVYDEFNNIVATETVDTYNLNTVSIPSDVWGAGNYSLTITYGTTGATGTFNLQ